MIVALTSSSVCIKILKVIIYVKIFNNNQSTALTQRDQYGNACTHDVGTIGVNSIYVLTRYEESPKLSQSFSIMFFILFKELT